MQIEAENFGSIVILTLSGPVTPQEVVQLINEAGEKCKACLHLVFNLDRAELSAPLLKPLFALREAQKYLKPQIWLASARHPGADARTTNDTLKLLDNPDGATIVKIATMKSEVANFAAKRDEIEHEIRQLLSLSEGYSQEDFDDALAAARANRAVAKHLATAAKGHVDELKKIRNTATSPDDAERAKQLAAAKDKAYNAVRGD